MSLEVLFVFLVSFAGSIIAGLTGMGGGVIVLAGLGLVLPANLIVPMHALNQFFSNLSRIIIHFKSIEFRIFYKFILLVPVGIFAGGKLAQFIETKWLYLMLSITILYSLYWPKGKTRFLFGPYAFTIAGFISGFMGMVIGVISPVIAPLFLKQGLLKERMIATKALCQSATHFMKILMFSTMINFNHETTKNYIIPLIVSSVLGTLVSKYFLKKINDDHFTMIIKILLTLIALQMLSKVYTS